MYRYLQNKIEGHMLLVNNACVLISRHKVGREQREIYTHAFFSRFTVFNDALNTFCLLFYGVRYMVRDQSERKPAAASSLATLFD